MPYSDTNNSVGSRTAAVGNVGAAVVVHVASNVRSQIAAVICNWKGLKNSSTFSTWKSFVKDLVPNVSDKSTYCSYINILHLPIY